MSEKLSASELLESDRTLALKRFKKIQPFLEDGVPLTQIVATENISLSTARRWVSRYRKAGLPGLVRKPRQDRGVSRCLNDEVKKLIEGLALEKPPKSKAHIYRQIVAYCDRQKQTAPSYSTVYGIIRDLDPALVTLAHDGTKAYRQEFDLLYRSESEGSNAIWQADHTLLDIWIKDEKEQPQRPWLTVIMDDYSRGIAGYFLSFSAPSAIQTALALRQAIWRKQDANWQICGIPKVLYTDHGSDFTSQHIEQVCLDLKIQLIFSQVGQPRGRGKIERFFLTVNQKNNSNYCRLIIVDEAERLKMGGIELFREIYDRGDIGLIFIGMPGLEKKLSRYPQLYSRIGFAHHYRSLSHKEMRFLLSTYWEKLGLSINPNDFTDVEAIATICRITNGNFRLVNRLFRQVERIMKINQLSCLTAEVVEAARDCLVIGSI